MDDHFFNRVGQTQSLFDLFTALSTERGRNDRLLEKLNSKVRNRVSGPVVLWGTGQQSEVLVKRLTRNGQSSFQVSAFVDSNPETWGTEFLKKDIIYIKYGRKRPEGNESNHQERKEGTEEN